jgi:hypothetical protein
MTSPRVEAVLSLHRTLNPISNRRATVNLWPKIQHNALIIVTFVEFPQTVLYAEFMVAMHNILAKSRFSDEIVGKL